MWRASTRTTRPGPPRTRPSSSSAVSPSRLSPCRTPCPPGSARSDPVTSKQNGGVGAGKRWPRRFVYVLGAGARGAGAGAGTQVVVLAHGLWGWHTGRGAGTQVVGLVHGAWGWHTGCRAGGRVVGPAHGREAGVGA